MGRLPDPEYRLRALGVDVTHVLIDGGEAPDTLGNMLRSQRFKELRHARDAEDSLVLLVEIAETYFHVAHQHLFAWT